MAKAVSVSVKKYLKITSALKLFRVQDARAALPQNCSLRKVKLPPISAYGTFGPCLPAGAPVSYPTENPKVALITRAPGP
jgi:hypothetical protein